MSQYRECFTVTFLSQYQRDKQMWYKCFNQEVARQSVYNYGFSRHRLNNTSDPVGLCEHGQELWERPEWEQNWRHIWRYAKYIPRVFWGITSLLLLLLLLLLSLLLDDVAALTMKYVYTYKGALYTSIYGCFLSAVCSSVNF